MYPFLDMTNISYTTHVYQKKQSEKEIPKRQHQELTNQITKHTMIIIINMFEGEDTFVWFSICLI